MTVDKMIVELQKLDLKMDYEIYKLQLSKHLDEKVTNPFIKEIRDSFEIRLNAPQGMRPWYNDNLGTGFKNPLSITWWRVPERFKSVEAAKCKITSEILDFIKNYCLDWSKLIMGWEEK